MNPYDPHRLSRHQRMLVRLGWWIALILLVVLLGVALVLASLAAHRGG